VLVKRPRAPPTPADGSVKTGDRFKFWKMTSRSGATGHEFLYRSES